MNVPNLMYIDGEWVAASDGRTLDIVDPATEETVDTIPVATEADVDRALEALDGCQRPRLHTFIATSDLHLSHKLHMSRGQALEAAARAVGKEAPWKFWDARDTRTVYGLAGFDPRSVPKSGVAHHALDDALYQVTCVQRALVRLRSLPQGGKP